MFNQGLLITLTKFVLSEQTYFHHMSYTGPLSIICFLLQASDMKPDTAWFTTTMVIVKWERRFTIARCYYPCCVTRYCSKLSDCHLNLSANVAAATGI